MRGLLINLVEGDNDFSLENTGEWNLQIVGLLDGASYTLKETCAVNPQSDDYVVCINPYNGLPIEDYTAVTNILVANGGTHFRLSLADIGDDTDLRVHITRAK